MRKFFKSKLNIALFSIQALALFLLCFSNIHGIFLIVSIILEGVFFIVYGVSYFKLNKKLDKEKSLYGMLPVNEEDVIILSKKNDKNKKFNILKGVMFIIFGISIVFLIIL